MYFQRIMQWVLGELVGKMCLVYINNVVVWGQNPRRSVVAHTREIIRRFAQAGMRLNGMKYAVF